ncbi:hypothetical protein [Shouchella clausii]|uniref:hypothetical protein n=1 Tax=Shouchella clausii TaxID=79880 RepID=UPI001C736851|nr:hypothetical protein [Shouchella clausii]MBX0320129.1 hypothetical protein [Shouchella clausii]MEB5480858.1 hypothetical protein [Shouchella clausii]
MFNRNDHISRFTYYIVLFYGILIALMVAVLTIPFISSFMLFLVGVLIVWLAILVGGFGVLRSLYEGLFIAEEDRAPWYKTSEYVDSSAKKSIPLAFIGYFLIIVLDSNLPYLAIAIVMFFIVNYLIRRR